MAVRQLPIPAKSDPSIPLLTQLSNLGPFRGPLQLVQTLDRVSGIPWLQAQSQYPKAYWQSRESDKELAATGCVRKFATANEASHCLSESAALPLVIMGALPFDDTNTPGTEQPLFFLPRLLWQRQDDNITLTLNLWVDEAHSFTDEMAAAKDALHTLRQPAHTPCPPLPDVLAVCNSPEQASWAKLVSQALAEQPILSKVVLARRQLLTTGQPCDPWLLLQRWHQANQHSTPFALQLDNQSSFIGCTPERLFKRDGRQLLSEAVAGTDVRPKDPLHARLIAMALLGDGKNRRENRIVLDDILSRLGPICDALSYDDRAQVLKLNRLQHLKRAIHGRLRKEICDADLLARLHPTPAVGGTPRADALRFIAAHEPFQRGWYAGAIGYLSHANSEFSVAIRSAHIEGCQLALYSGAGIVDGSDAHKEWQELDNKVATVRSLMGQK
ncbi:isochorismate synthase [Corallincola spongiicola]|uniref:Isochorismate synthase MenF n=1 Tax=Corallincola spongiicola TaxID=2520508 RepID=A0ABY1WN96_9GAMM|nr:isochorismate synthase [Corallincola spongiicola]TAA45036.1 isochorismate synthase [Corallincola spongiicola]